MIKLGIDGKPAQLDVGDAKQRNDLYDGIIEIIEQCYRDGKPASSKIGFSVAPQTDPLDEKALPAA